MSDTRAMAPLGPVDAGGWLLPAEGGPRSCNRCGGDITASGSRLSGHRRERAGPWGDLVGGSVVIDLCAACLSGLHTWMGSSGRSGETASLAVQAALDILDRLPNEDELSAMEHPDDWTHERVYDRLSVALEPARLPHAVR